MNTTTPEQDAWDSFGYDAQAFACQLGLPVQETALLIASVFTGLTGPLSGLSTLGGRGIPDGINLMGVTPGGHRLKRLVDCLLGPAFSMQGSIRQAATRSSKSLTDIATFGAGDLKEWVTFFKSQRTPLHEKLLPQFEAVLKDLESGDSLYTGWDNPDALKYAQIDGNPELQMVARTPGLRHCPSFLLSLANAENLPAMLDEVPERHGLIVDLDGHLFRPDASAKARAARRQLAGEMGGADAFVPKLHPDQGYGSFQRSGIRLISIISEDRLAEALGHSGTPESDILRHSILIKPEWQPPALMKEGLIQPVLQRYKAVLVRLINERTPRHGTVLRPGQEEERGLEKLDHEFVDTLDAYPASLHPHLKPFAGLVYRLYWAFSLLKWERKTDWCLSATKATALSALEGHVGILENALSQAKAREIDQWACRVVRVLQQKGASTTRSIQRSLNNSKAVDIAHALDLLMEGKKAVYRRASKTYDLPGDEALDDPELRSRGTYPPPAIAHG